MSHRERRVRKAARRRWDRNTGGTGVGAGGAGLSGRDGRGLLGPHHPPQGNDFIAQS